MNIYLDIDGVLLASEGTQARYAEDFLKYVLEQYPETTYWLTTHCKGDATTPIQHIGYLFSEEAVERMKMIKPTNWDMWKTDGIDFNQSFLWFDDFCFDTEQKVLIEHGVLENWIEVRLQDNPNHLKQFLDDFPVPVNL